MPLRAPTDAEAEDNCFDATFCVTERDNLESIGGRERESAVLRTQTNLFGIAISNSHTKNPSHVLRDN
jgi:hypothetical protein